MNNTTKRLIKTGAAVGAAKLAYDGINEGWFYELCDRSYKFVRDNAPEGVRKFIDKHPVYTAGLEGLTAGFIAGAATFAAYSKMSRRHSK